MNSYTITNAIVINEGKSTPCDLFIDKGRIEKIAPCGHMETKGEVIDAKGKWLLPGVIDDQVHFREPGFTHKADIASESRAAVAGGTTSFMEMPNTNPQSTTLEALEAKFQRAAEVSPANYSFFLGATNENLETLKLLNDDKVCGIKIFMGSSTGNMLVDHAEILESIFAQIPELIAVHCEDEATVRNNLAKHKAQGGTLTDPALHPIIRSREACYLSSSFAVNLAKKHQTRLHVLHISTMDEISLFSNELPLELKKITAEACVHHLWFSDKDYAALGNKIKCNPAIKTEADREAVWKGLAENYIDIIATDHAPHTMEEKGQAYEFAPAGLPLIQYSLNMMMSKAIEGKVSPEWVVEKMCHAPAKCFKLLNRGYIKEGYFADFVIFDPNASTTISADKLLYKCGWSPLEGTTLKGKVDSTWVNGVCVYADEKLTGALPGTALRFAKI